MVKRKSLPLCTPSNKNLPMRPEAFLPGNISPRPQGPRKMTLILQAQKCFSPPPPSRGNLSIASRGMSPQ